jgi:hypothetical protein
METLHDIAARWKTDRTFPWAGETQTAFRRELISPETRAWFKACAVAVKADPGTKVLSELTSCITSLGPERRRIACAQIKCVQAARAALAFDIKSLARLGWEASARIEDARENVVFDEGLARFRRESIVPRSKSLNWDELMEIIKTDLDKDRARWVGGELSSKARFHVDATFRALGRQAAHRSDARLQYLAEAWNLVLKMLDGDRTCLRTVETFVVLLEDVQENNLRRTEGRITRLVLECLAEGIGVLYPAPAMAFVTRPHIVGKGENGERVIKRNEFRDGEDNATHFARGLHVWDEPFDVRWSLKSRKPGEDLPLEISGPSAGAAFGVGIAKVLLPD